MHNNTSNCQLDSHLNAGYRVEDTPNTTYFRPGTEYRRIDHEERLHVENFHRLGSQPGIILEMSEAKSTDR